MVKSMKNYIYRGMMWYNARVKTDLLQKQTLIYLADKYKNLLLLNLWVCGREASE